MLAMPNSMLPYGIIGMFVLVIVLAVGFRLLAGSLDRSRIRNYVGERGGIVQSIRWTPFGRGWFGSKNERIYEVLYTDSQGRGHTATCKTSILSGVYFTDDTTNDDPLRGHFPLQEPPVMDEAEQLRLENQRLREENERLRRGQL